MKEEAFVVSIDPHPHGQLRLRHYDDPIELWDFETTSGVVTIRKIIEIIDDYCFSGGVRTKIYFEQNALDLVKGRIASMEEELNEYKYIISNIVYPFEEKAAVSTANGDRRRKKPLPSQKLTKV